MGGWQPNSGSCKVGLLLLLGEGADFPHLNIFFSFRHIFLIWKYFPHLDIFSSSGNIFLIWKYFPHLEMGFTFLSFPIAPTFKLLRGVCSITFASMVEIIIASAYHICVHVHDWTMVSCVLSMLFNSCLNKSF